MTGVAGRRPFWAGIIIALIWILLDQGQKYWSLQINQMVEGESWAVFPGFNFTMVWNPGISYGLLPQGSELGRWALVGFRLVATLALLVWLWQTSGRLAALALGCIIGGAFSNAIDGVVYGAVADFYHLYYGAFSWYVFNIADVAIVAGVGLLLYETMMETAHPGDAA